MNPTPQQSQPVSLAFPDLAHITGRMNDTFSQALALPFDTARLQYAHAVRLGLIERSMLRSRDFEAMLAQLEQTVLGPWARRS